MTGIYPMDEPKKRKHDADTGGQANELPAEAEVVHVSDEVDDTGARAADPRQTVLPLFETLARRSEPEAAGSDPFPVFRPLLGHLLSYGSLIVIGIGFALCPPWRAVINARGVRAQVPIGYAPLWAPPNMKSEYTVPVSVEPDARRLVLQYLALAGVGLLLRKKVS